MVNAAPRIEPAPTTQPPPLINGRYRLIEKIGSGGMGVVYAAEDRLTGTQVALKQVTRGLHDDADFALHLAREFQLLASLRHPNIISVLDYGIIPGEPATLFYTMELLPGARTFCDAAELMSLDEQMRALVALFEALVYLHRRGVLHCDLKPENILVGEGGQVKVVDFGLSILREQVDSRAGEIIGTLAYMAPELFDGAPISEASDLYSAGLVVYEVLTNSFPYPLSPISDLISAIRRSDPDLMPLFTLTPPARDGLSGELIFDDTPTLPTIVGRMLEKRPHDRPASAAEVLALMARAGLPVEAERAEIRDSFLQAAAFTGRTSELNRLRAGLKRTIAGSGGAFLIGGESGIGKTRLVDELRVYALTDGALVLTGQAVEGGGLLYQIWREPLRRLVLTTPLTDFQAGVLKDILPDLDTLLDRRVRYAPQLDAAAARSRLVLTISEVMAAARQPTLLILEDLHWARESLDVLRALLPLTAANPLMIVATFRADEADLFSEFPDMTAIPLARLTADEIAALSTSMLGAEVARPLVPLLEAETEGNVLFLVEVVRSLAEDAGALDRIDASEVEGSPFRTMAGGMQTLLRRRLHRLPAGSQRLLTIAALIGRGIDRPILDKAVLIDPDAMPRGGIETWLLTCADKGVLAITDGQWRFAHDKLREVLRIDVMERGDLPRFSRVIAQSIEAAYPNDRERAPALAEHWHNVGDIAREATALETAAEVALENAFYDRALEWLARARPLVSSDPDRTVRLLGQSVEACYNLGMLDRARAEALRALKMLGFDLTDDPAVQQRQTGRLLARFGALWLRGRALRTAWNAAARRMMILPGGAPDVRVRLALRLFEQLMLIHYFMNRQAETTYFALNEVILTESTVPTRTLERVSGYATAGIALVASQPRLSNFFFRRADSAAEFNTDANTVSWHMMTSAIGSVFHADWDETEWRVRRCIQVAEASLSLRRLEEAYTTYAGALYYQGRWDECRAVVRDLQRVAARSGNVQARAWAMDNEGRFALREGRFAEARASFAASRAIYEKAGDQMNRLWTIGAAGKSYLYEGDLDSAAVHCEAVIAAVRDVAQTSFGMTEPLSAAAEYALHRWRARPDDPALAASAAQGVAALRRYSRVVWLARPRVLLMMAWQGAIGGHPAAGLRHAGRSLALANRLHMPYDAALARAAWGNLLPVSDPRRAEALAQARAVLESLGARADVDELDRCPIGTK